MEGQGDKEIRGQGDKGTRRQGDVSFSLSPCLLLFLSHHHHGHAALSRFVEFDQEDSLPAPQLESTVCDVDADGHRQEEGFAMRMAIGGLIRRDVDAAAEVVMLVVARTRRQAFEHALQILEQRGSFSLTMIAVVVCFVCTLTQPCLMPARATISSTASVTSTNCKHSLVRRRITL